MPSSYKSRARALSLNPLAACLAALLGVTDAPATPTHPHGAIVVTNCLDSGNGSLRQAVTDWRAGRSDRPDPAHLRPDFADERPHRCEPRFADPGSGA